MMETLEFITAKDDLISLQEKAIRNLKKEIQGEILIPTDPDYYQSRMVWNGMIDKYPAVIVKCKNTDDIKKAVAFSNKHQLKFSVRGGGHHVAGGAILNKGMVIDLSGMKKIELDQNAHTVTAEAGATYGDLDTYTQKYGLAVPGGLVSTTGIAGLTLGGGIGWLRRKYGLACDNLVSAEVITAQGDLLQVNDHSHSDLFWALKGGGSGFGIVTSFTFKAYPIGPKVAMALIFYPASFTENLLRYIREKAAKIPEEVSFLLIYGTVPEDEMFPENTHGKEYILFGGMYTGEPSEGEKIFQPFRELGNPILDLSGVMSYTEAQTLFDAEYPKHELHYYWKSLFFDQLSDEAIMSFIELGKSRPSPLSTVDIWHLGGAIDRVGLEESAYPHRGSTYLLGIESNWRKIESDERNIDWTRRAIEKFRSYSGGHSYLNFEDREIENIEAAQGDSYQRLMAIKDKYDPKHLIS